MGLEGRFSLWAGTGPGPWVPGGPVTAATWRGQAGSVNRIPEACASVDKALRVAEACNPVEVGGESDGRWSRGEMSRGLRSIAGTNMLQTLCLAAGHCLTGPQPGRRQEPAYLCHPRPTSCSRWAGSPTLAAEPRVGTGCVEWAWEASTPRRFQVPEPPWPLPWVLFLKGTWGLPGLCRPCCPGPLVQMQTTISM